MSHVVPSVKTPEFAVTSKSEFNQPEVRLPIASKPSGNDQFSKKLSKELEKKEFSPLPDNKLDKNPDKNTKQSSVSSGHNAADSEKTRNSQQSQSAEVAVDTLSDSQVKSLVASKERGKYLPPDGDATVSVGLRDDLVNSELFDAEFHQLSTQPVVNDYTGPIHSIDAVQKGSVQADTDKHYSATVLNSQTTLELSYQLQTPNNSKTKSEYPAALVPHTLQHGGNQRLLPAVANSLVLTSTAVNANVSSSEVKPLLGITTTGLQASKIVSEHGAVSKELNASMDKALLSHATSNNTNIQAAVLSQNHPAAYSLPLEGQDAKLLSNHLIPLSQKYMDTLSAEYLDRMSLMGAKYSNANNPVIAEQISRKLIANVESNAIETEPEVIKGAITPLRTQQTSSQTTPLVFQISSQLTSATWGQDVGQRVYWMVKQNIQQAEMHLNPRHLGPMEVKISLGADQQVNVSFTTQHNMVKEAIDAAMPRLRDMLDNQGLNLGNVNVSNESNRHSHQHSSDGNEQPQEEQSLLLLGEAQQSIEHQDAAIKELSKNGFVDVYA